MVQEDSTKAERAVRGEASTFQVLILVVFALVTLFLIGYFTVFNVKPALEYTEWKTSCAESVKAHTLFALGDLATRPPITCPLLEITIDDDMRDVSGQLHAKSKITRLMKDCWDI